MAISWLLPGKQYNFPSPEHATEQGLLAAGGDLSPQRLLQAYQQGIFPWFNHNDPILWWNPDPRMILIPDELIIRKSLNRVLRKTPFKVTIDRAFSEVMHACAAPRRQDSAGQSHDTWIHDEIISAYTTLFEHGYAHSIECWLADELVGGLYGVAVGKVFFGESMFSFATDSSKVALVALSQQLQRWDFEMIDCQIYSDHLSRLGAKEIPRATFLSMLSHATQRSHPVGIWQLDDDIPYAI